MELAEFATNLEFSLAKTPDIHWRLIMNSTNPLLVPTIVIGSELTASLRASLTRCAHLATSKQVLLLEYVACSALLLAVALDIQITILIVSFFSCGLWASHRLSRKSSMMLTPIFVLFNLILWREAFLALPIAALTIAIAQRFPVQESWRDFLKLSGVVGASLALIHMYGQGILQSLAAF